MTKRKVLEVSNEKCSDSLCGEGCKNKAVYFFDIGTKDQELVVKFCKSHKNCDNYRYAVINGKRFKP